MNLSFLDSSEIEDAKFPETYENGDAQFLDIVEFQEAYSKLNKENVSLKIIIKNLMKQLQMFAKSTQYEDTITEIIISSQNKIMTLKNRLNILNKQNYNISTRSNVATQSNNDITHENPQQKESNFQNTKNESNSSLSDVIIQQNKEIEMLKNHLSDQIEESDRLRQEILASPKHISSSLSYSDSFAVNKDFFQPQLKSVGCQCDLDDIVKLKFNINILSKSMLGFIQFVNSFFNIIIPNINFQNGDYFHELTTQFDNSLNILKSEMPKLKLIQNPNNSPIYSLLNLVKETVSNSLGQMKEDHDEIVLKLTEIDEKLQ